MSEHVGAVSGMVWKMNFKSKHAKKYECSCLNICSSFICKVPPDLCRFFFLCLTHFWMKSPYCYEMGGIIYRHLHSFRALASHRRISINAPILFEDACAPHLAKSSGLCESFNQVLLAEWASALSPRYHAIPQDSCQLVLRKTGWTKTWLAELNSVLLSFACGD